MTSKKSYLIAEGTHAVTPNVIAEQKTVTKFVAEIQEAEKPNRNGRIYSKEALEGAIRHYSIQEKLKNKALYGESGHPLSDDPKRQMYIDQNNISHIVTDLWWEDGNRLMASIETADTRAGRDMRGLIRQGSKVAFSMRGMSDNVRKDGQYVRVGSPLMITTWDWVIVPSHPNSYMINESVGFGSTVQAPAANVLTEGTLTPVDTAEMLNFISKKSTNIQEMVDKFGFSFDTHEGKDQLQAIEEDNAALAEFLRESLTAELDSYLETL